MSDSSKVPEGFLAAMVTTSSVLLGFAFYFFREWNSGIEDWDFPIDMAGLIPIAICTLAFILTILLTLYPKQPTFKRMLYAWISIFVGIVSFIGLAVVSAIML